MNDKQKSQLISTIIAHLRFAAKAQKKQFKEGDTFFALCFKSDDELQRIAKLVGI